MSNRRKGKEAELWLCKLLRPLFPDVQRNLCQAEFGGSDVVNTPGFQFEMKKGRKYKSAMIRSVLSQMERNHAQDEVDVAVMHPDREKPYVAVPLDQFLAVLQCVKLLEAMLKQQQPGNLPGC